MKILGLWNKLGKSTRDMSLAQEMSKYIEDGSTALDVGCGDGSISQMINESCKLKLIDGLEIRKVSKNKIHILLYNGKNFPVNGRKYDYVFFIDSLHHSVDIEKLLAQAKRTSKKFILIKDHYYDTSFQRTVLKIADILGNKADGVPLPFNYLTLREWGSLFKKLGLKIKTVNKEFKITSLDPVKHVIFKLSV